MEIKKVTDKAFGKYGKIIENINFTELVEVLSETPDCDSVIYEPSAAELEHLPVFSELQTKTYGELPIQIGYCNGRNHLLNAFEYHRSSEINVGGTDAILILGLQKDITKEFTYDTLNAEAFFLPKGTAVEIYATTLHYAPCSVNGKQFKVAVVLPKGTNLPLESVHEGWEDQLLSAKNKWLIGHPEGGLAEGTYLGLVGKNLSINE
ncbi:MAG: DUF4867 family protein [Lachnospiraceae bacterium]